MALPFSLNLTTSLCIVDSPEWLTSAFRNIRAAKAKMISTGTSLLVQWLRLQAPNTGGLGSIPGQGTRSYIHACMHAETLQSCPTLYNTMDCSPPGSSVHGMLQARILEWVAITSSRGPSQPRDRTCVSYVSCIDRWVLYC